MGVYNGSDLATLRRVGALLLSLTGLQLAMAAEEVQTEQGEGAAAQAVDSQLQRIGLVCSRLERAAVGDRVQMVAMLDNTGEDVGGGPMTQVAFRLT